MKIAAIGLGSYFHQIVRAVTATERGGSLPVQCEAGGDCELEMWGVPRRS